MRTPWLVAWLVALVVLGAVPAGADIEVQRIYWRMPKDTPPVDGFKVYAATGATGVQPLFQGAVAAGYDGTYSIAVGIEVGVEVFVWVSAYNAAGEGPRSAVDAYFITPGGKDLGAPGRPIPIGTD